MLRNRLSAASLLGTFLLLAGCAGEEPAPQGAEAAPVAAAAPAEPTAGDRDFAELTASWAPELRESCAKELQEALGTRDLVEGALAGVSDPGGKAAAELEDALHWKAEGDAQIDAVRERLRAGTCDGEVQVALEEAVQYYVKAGTSAVQAGQIAGS